MGRVQAQRGGKIPVLGWQSALRVLRSTSSNSLVVVLSLRRQPPRLKASQDRRNENIKTLSTQDHSPATDHKGSQADLGKL